MVCLSIFSGIFLYALAELSFPSAMTPTRYPPPFPPQMMGAPTFPGQGLSVSSGSGKVSAESIEEKNKRLEEDQKRYEEREKEWVRLDSIKSAVRSVIVMLITSLVFFFHWRIAKKVRGENDV